MNKKTVSVIIPAFNEEDSIERLLNALKEQKPNPEFNLNIVVVDNGSTDLTFRGAAQFCSDLPNFHVIKASPTNRSVARNHGAGYAKSLHTDILIFLDCDCDFNEKFINELIAPIGIDKVVSQALLMPRNLSTAICHLSFPFIDTKAFAIREKDFAAIGNFDESLPRCEDIDFGWRAFESKFDVVVATDAICRTGELKSLKQGFFRGLETAQGLAKVHQKWHRQKKLSVAKVFIGFFNIASRELNRAQKSSAAKHAIFRLVDNATTFIAYWYYRFKF